MLRNLLVRLAAVLSADGRAETRLDDAARDAALAGDVPPGHAVLYVYRQCTTGRALAWDVSLDGKSLAQLRSPRFAHRVLKPGPHTLCVSVRGFAGALHRPSYAVFVAEPGEAIVFAARTQTTALNGTVRFVREADPRAALEKLAGTPMVAASPPRS
jgi:hypothetical protein